MIKGESGIRELEKLLLLGLADRGASLNAPNKCAELLLAMVSLEYMGKRNGSPLKVPMRGKG